MSYVDSNLIQGEQVLYRTHMHWIVLAAPVVLCGFFLVLPGLILMTGGLLSEDSNWVAGVGFFFWLISAAIVGLAWLQRNSVEMAVTNKRVIAKAGVLSRRTIEMMLAKVESIGVDQSIVGRMFDYGSITVRGSGGTTEAFKKIAGPLEFRRQVQQQLDSSQNRAVAGAPVA